MPKEGPGLSRSLARYLTAEGVPVVWNAAQSTFDGISGVVMKRMNPRNEVNLWARMPEHFRKHEKGSDLPLVMFVTTRGYGENVSDSFVVMRIGTLVRWLGPLVRFDRERWVSRK